MSRVFEGRRVWRMDPDQYWVATRLLAMAARERFGSVDMVIGIANGGRAPAYAIGAETGAVVVIVEARHNASEEIGIPATGEVTYDLSPIRQTSPGPILVVDDICGSGATLTAVVSGLSKGGIRTVTLCRNAGAPPGLPDLYVWEVADWVIFPWEQTPPGQQTSRLPDAVGVRSW
ncbi:phosphoribosyltransferase [Spongiactinospora gelatinilytica]|uniref:Phosphoribosyltransferase n=1 Tax=Spongiactinospora gelatinilytica TaxID=2666298 RepID=A0A2W2G3P7_9ACTN|nr:phosphoribosyltransferase family protein [Spongiactinospora gelatinilytica]PZG44536.1 phosphoribosyltransferase [Spongiactinospora gelatinilytica]